MKRFLLVVALVAAAVPDPASGQEGPRIAHQPAEGRPYSAAVQVGNIYWLSGKVGATPETRALAVGRTAAETHNIMRSFRELLTDLGMNFGNLVQSVVYLSDIADYAEMNEAYAQYFGEGPPARVTVAVSGIVGDGAIEISFVAVKN